jgi:AraC-like DNA-binding protein
LSPRLDARYRFGGLRFEEVVYPAGLWMPAHTHEQVFLDLCLEGTIQEAWGTQRFARGPATMTLMPAGAPHGTHFPGEARTFQIVLEAPWLERIRQVSEPVERLTCYENGLPTWIAARMHREFQRRDNLSPLVLEGMLLELLAETTRESSGGAERQSPRWLQQAQDFLHAHFTESLSVEAVATAAGVHPSHLMRGFRQYHRCTIGDFVRRLRVEYACHLLATSDASAAEIARTAGFADQSHFSRTFKGCIGMTPLAFQKSCGRASGRQNNLLSDNTAAL